MLDRGFNVRKAAQVVAYFARSQGGQINVLKLIKLVYLADRESLARFDAPILYDHMVSMDHGPVNSATLDLVNGLATDSEDWSEFVGERKGNDVPLALPIDDDTLDELSKRDLRLLGAIWDRFGYMDKYQVRDFTHDHCPEWEDPHGSSNPIPYHRILKFLGKPNADDLAQDIESRQLIKEKLERYSYEQESELGAV